MDEGITPSALAATAGLSNAAVTKVVDHLVALDYVRRENNPRDGRSTRLVRTGGFHAAMGEAYAGLSQRHEVLAVSNRLQSLGRNGLPIPKGVDPFKVRAGRPR